MVLFPLLKWSYNLFNNYWKEEKGKVEMQREDHRQWNELRPISFELCFTKWAEGSVLTKFGDTHLLCNVTIENQLPAWLKSATPPQGWLTAEYGMLPRSTKERNSREQRWPKGRTQEISRLIGRSLRMAVDLTVLGQRTVTVDCDVLQADGGTRTAAISGGWVALCLALHPLIKKGELPASVLKHQVAAVSAGILGDSLLLDLAYSEDSVADVDMNLVMTSDGQLVEVQGTAEKTPMSRQRWNELLDLATAGIVPICAQQQQALKLMEKGDD